MTDFIFGALPWIVFGVVIALVLINVSNKKKKSDAIEKENTFENVNIKKKEGNIEEDYMSIGMSLGMGIGVAIGSSLVNTFGSNAITYGICFGMLGGMIIGMCIKKN